MTIRKVAVFGAGQMGRGIAQTFAQNGYMVALYDPDAAALVRAEAAIEAGLSRLAAKGRITEEERREAIARLATAAEVGAAAADADFAVEAIPENLALKQALFRELDALCKPQAILATNTSSLPITAIAAATNRPERVIGMHFMNPVPVMPLVEVIRGAATSDETAGAVLALAGSLGKTAVEAKDFPGFVSNRVLMPMINEAAFAVYEGVASAEAVDLVMKLGMNHPMGPLTLADYIGLDTCLAIMETLHAGFGDPKYRPCPLLRSHVQAGWLGRKTGRGFYRYDSN